MRFCGFSAVPGWFLTNITTQKKVLTHPRPALCDAEGPGLEEWVTIRAVVSQRPFSSTHAFRNIGSGSTSRSAAILREFSVYWRG
jgi:hypothetical protein